MEEKKNKDWLKDIIIYAVSFTIARILTDLTMNYIEDKFFCSDDEE